MVGASNVCAFVGRIVGGACPPFRLCVLVLEGMLFLICALVAIAATQRHALPSPYWLGPAIAGSTTLWANVLLVHLSTHAQAQIQHSLASKPCPITAQISWVAIQIGCVGGAAFSFLPPLQLP